MSDEHEQNHDRDDEATRLELNAIEIRTGFEAEIGSLEPIRSRIDRDAVMYRAGQASGRRSAPTSRRWAWPAVAAGLALFASSEGVLLAVRPSTRVVERVVVVREPASRVTISNPVVARLPEVANPPESLARPGPTAHDRLADQLIRYGLDGLPPAPANNAWGERRSVAASSRSTWQEELRKDIFPGDPS